MRNSCSGAQNPPRPLASGRVDRASCLQPSNLRPQRGGEPSPSPPCRPGAGQLLARRTPSKNHPNPPPNPPPNTLQTPSKTPSKPIFPNRTSYFGGVIGGGFGGVIGGGFGGLYYLRLENVFDPGDIAAAVQMTHTHSRPQLLEGTSMAMGASLDLWHSRTHLQVKRIRAI